MTDETLGITGVFVLAGILFLLRHLILTVGKRKRRPALQSSAPPARSSLRVIDTRSEKKRQEPIAKRAIGHSHPRSFPRFPI